MRTCTLLLVTALAAGFVACLGEMPTATEGPEPVHAAVQQLASSAAEPQELREDHLPLLADVELRLLPRIADRPLAAALERELRSLREPSMADAVTAEGASVARALALLDAHRGATAAVGEDAADIDALILTLEAAAELLSTGSDGTRPRRVR